MTSTLIAYRTKSQCERKAQKELREAGVKAYVPTEKRRWGKGERRVPTARQYVFAAGLKPHDAEHVGQMIPGVAARPNLLGLYIRTSKSQRKHAFATGDKVVSASGYPGTVRRVHGSGRYDVEVVIAHKPCVVKMKESDLTRAHPHT